LTNTEECTISHSSQPTGDYCYNCGRELYVFKIFILGKDRKLPIMCPCRAEFLENDKMKEDLRRRQDYLNRLFKQSRLGERFKSSNFDDYKVTKDTKFIFDKVKSYSDNFNDNKKRSILMYGPPGTGKTTLSSALVNSILIKGITAIFVSVPDLFSQIIASYSSTESSEDKILRGLTDCELLVMDEMALRKPKEKDSWAVEKLYQIVNSRYANMKSTVFTTNCDLREFSIRLGTSTFSRIMEMSKGMTFDFSKATDWRMQNILSDN